MNEVKDSVEFYRNLWAGAEARLADCESSLVQSQAEVARLRAALVEARVQVDCIEHYSDDAEACELSAKAIEVIDAALEPTR